MYLPKSLSRGFTFNTKRIQSNFNNRTYLRERPIGEMKSYGNQGQNSITLRICN